MREKLFVGRFWRSKKGVNISSHAESGHYHSSRPVMSLYGVPGSRRYNNFESYPLYFSKNALQTKFFSRIPPPVYTVSTFKIYQKKKRSQPFKKGLTNPIIQTAFPKINGSAGWAFFPYRSGPLGPCAQGIKSL